VSGGAERGAPFPAGWPRLERSAEEAALALALWKRRATEAEDDVRRLREALEELAGERDGTPDAAHEILRLKAENAALRSRMLQARKRVSALTSRLAALELEA
jgi:hypothetical protein